MRKCSPMTIMVNKWCTSLPSHSTYSKLHTSSSYTCATYVLYRDWKNRENASNKWREYFHPKIKTLARDEHGIQSDITFFSRRSATQNRNTVEKLQNLLLIAIPRFFFSLDYILFGMRCICCFLLQTISEFCVHAKNIRKRGREWCTQEGHKTERPESNQNP